MFADMLFKSVGVLPVILSPSGKELIPEPVAAVGVLFGKNEAVGDVYQLTGVIVGEKLGQLRISEGGKLRDIVQIRGHVIVSGCLFKGKSSGVIVDLSVKHGLVLGNYSHGLKPVGACGLDVEFALGVLTDDAEYGELI